MRRSWTRSHPRVQPWWAVMTVWVVVNAVNLLQTAGFLSRVPSGSTTVNHLLGYVIVALAVPATVALVALGRAGADFRYRIGPIAFLVFVSLMIAVDHVWGGEFRSPARYEILVPYLALFFGSIVLMGAPMLRLDRRLWSVTATTSAMLLGAMGVAMHAGVG